MLLLKVLLAHQINALLTSSVVGMYKGGEKRGRQKKVKAYLAFTSLTEITTARLRSLELAWFGSPRLILQVLGSPIPPSRPVPISRNFTR